jgi:hypothetical protein
MKFFIAAVTKHIIERHLMRPLPTIISSRILALLTEEEVQFIATEDDDVKQMREHLEDRQEILLNGQAAFRKALGQIP